MSATKEPTETIMVRLNRVGQLFNTFDPSPFNEKDLDDDAEEFIVGWARDFGDKDFRICFGVPADEAVDVNAGDVATAVHNHFAYRVKEEERQLRLQFRRGRITLLIAVVFLAGCLSLRAIVAPLLPAAVEPIVSESLLIIGWVAMWGPLDVFLYGWWPIVERLRLYRRLAKAPVEVRKVN